MSTTIDQKVVEMRFDNKHFEKNTAQTMSTLDKLKQKLNLSGASKGLENINSAANKVNMSGMSKAIETVHTKFSALEVMGVTALANITNQAVNAGKRMISALTIDPVKTGLSEYETQINSIQTIMANVGHKGNTLDDVNKALDELNHYADQTIYNFTEMTRNIGLFTNAGVGLDESVKAIKGFSNAAAMAGTDATRTAGAMYQLSQAMSSGSVRLIDWKSLEIANITGERFQETIKTTARAHGIAIDDMIKKEGTLRETLHSGWLTADLMAEALDHYTLSTELMTEEEIKANKERLRSMGYTDKQITQLFELGTEANNAATKVKTFTQLWGVLKESAQSGWAKTWQIIIGDFEEAKALFSPLAEYLTGIIGKMSDARNALLEGALGKSFKNLKKTLATITKPIKTAVDGVKKVTTSLEDLEKMANKVIRGDFGNGKKRFKELTEAGYNYYAIQNRVNEKLGDGFRYSEDLVNSHNNLTKAQKEGAEAQGEITKAQSNNIEMLMSMSDAQLKNIGYTDEQIQALRDLKKYSDMTGLSVKDFLENIDEIDGRWLLINALKNAGQGLVTVFESIGNAWKEVFKPMTSDQLFGIIAGLHKFSTYLVVGDETADKLKRTLKGLFSILKIIVTLVGGPIKIIFKAITQLLQALDIIPHDFLGITAAIGDTITGFSEWLDKVLDFTKVFEALAPHIKEFGKSIKDWFLGLGEVGPIKKFIEHLNSAKEAISKWIEGLKETDNIGQYILDGLVNGLKNGGKIVLDAIIALGTTLIEGIKGILGIHSPSTVFAAIGGFVIAGFVLGLKDGFPQVWETIKELGAGLANVIKSIDFGKLFAAGLAVGLILVVNKMLGVISSFAAPLEGFGNLLTDLGNGITDLTKGLKMKMMGEAMKNFAISIAILAVSILLLCRVDPLALWSTIGAILALTAIMGALAFAASKMQQLGDFGKSSLSLAGIAGSLLLLALSLKTLGSIEPDRMLSAINGMIACLIALGTLIFIIGKFLNAKEMANIDKVGKMVKKISIALLVMVGVIKIASWLKTEEIIKGFGVMVLFGMFIAAMIAVSHIAGESGDKTGKLISKVAFALLVMVGVIKIASLLKPEEILKGFGVIMLLGIFIAAMIAVSYLAGEHASKAGTMILKVSMALLVMVGVIKLAGMLNGEDILKGIAVITLFGVFCAGLIAVSYFAGQHATKAGTMLLMVSGALLIMSGVLFLLSKMSSEGMGRALGIITVLGALFAGLIFVSQYANDSVKTLWTLTAIIGILSLIVVGLSFMDPKKALSATGSLSLLMATLAGVLVATKFMGKPEKMFKSLLPLVGIVALLGVVVAVMSNVTNPAGAIASAGALSILMVTLTGVLFILTKMTTVKITDLIAGLAGLAVLVIMLYGVVGALALMSGIQNAAKNATALGVFMGVLAVVQLLCAAAGAIYAATGFIAMLGLAGMVALVGTLYILMGALAIMSNIPNAISNLTALQSFMVVMTGILVVLAVVGPLALIGVTAMAALTLLMGGIALFATAIGALMQKFPALQSFLDTGLPVMIQLAGAIGEMIGAFVSGVLTQISAGLPEIGANLSLFMYNLIPFIAGAKMIDGSVLAGVGIMVGTILALTAAQLLTGIVSILTLGSSFSQLGTELSLFMMNAMPFILLSRQIDPAIMTGVKTLAEAFLILTAANLLDGIVRFISGGSSLETFAAQLPLLGDGLNGFINAVGPVTKEQVETATNAANIIKTLASAAKEIPNTGGLLADLIGDNDMAAWAAQLPNVAKGIVGFVTTITDGGIAKEAVDTAKTAADVITTLAEAASEIPNTGGLLASLIGDNDLGTFASQLPNVGKGIVGFVNAMTEGKITEENAKVAETAAGIIGVLAKTAKEIPNSGGLLAGIVGDNDLSKFASELPNVGKGIAGFANEIGTFDDKKLATVAIAVKALETIVGMAVVNEQYGAGTGLKEFGDNMVKFAKKVKEFLKYIGDIGTENIDAAIDKTAKLIAMAKDVASTSVESIKTFGDSLKSFAKDGVNGFVNEFSGEEPKKKAANGMKAMLDAAIKGAEDKKDDVSNKFESICKAAIKATSSWWIMRDIKQAGKDMAEGFAKGVESGNYLAKNAGSALGEAALNAAKAALDEHSPSKEAYKVGSFFGEGLVLGIDDYASKTYDAGYAVAEQAKSGLSRAISKVSALIDSGMDTQPTIRPVLDLSDVENGVGAISGMFSNGPSVGVMANLRSISSGMDARIQNGSNNDVVSAIDKLRKDLGNTGGDTYNVDGITYDDGSNITEAVKALIRAAKVERRT